MTKFSGGHGAKFDGNSILLEIKKKSYVYIGSEIFAFKTDNDITDYVSPVGNNDVPYPYAIDSEMNYYLMIENVKLKILTNQEDPYKYYYQANLLTPDLAFHKLPIYYSGISEFRIDNEPYTLRYDIDPIKEFKRLQKDIGKNIQIKLIDGAIIKLTAQKYKKIMDDFNEKIQVKKIA
jgi:hypothetical protein